jgi:rubrerythrin
MANIFSPQEILRIAVRVEENGAKLYETLGMRAINPTTKAMWNYLKEQDALHRVIFMDMLDKVGDFVINEVYPGEYSAYIHAVASEYVFMPELISRKITGGFSSELEAIDFGITIEKESIFTYTSLKGYLATAKQPIIDKIIEEEKGHLVQLVDLKLSLAK